MFSRRAVFRKDFFYCNFFKSFTSPWSFLSVSHIMLNKFPAILSRSGIQKNHGLHQFIPWIYNKFSQNRCTLTNFKANPYVFLSLVHEYKWQEMIFTLKRVDKMFSLN